MQGRGWRRGGHVGRRLTTALGRWRQESQEGVVFSYKFEVRLGQERSYLRKQQTSPSRKMVDPTACSLLETVCEASLGLAKSAP